MLHRIRHGLLGEFVFQLKSGYGQTVNEDTQIESKLSFVFAVAELAGDAEDVGPVQFLGLGVAGGGSPIEEVNLRRPVLDPFAENIDHASFGDFPLQPGDELLSLWAVFLQPQLWMQFWPKGLISSRIGMTPIDP